MSANKRNAITTTEHTFEDTKINESGRSKKVTTNNPAHSTTQAIQVKPRPKNGDNSRNQSGTIESGLETIESSPY